MNQPRYVGIDVAKESFEVAADGDRETIRGQQSQYGTKNRERILEHRREHYAENRDQILERQRERYAANRERILASWRKRKRLGAGQS